MLHRLVQSSDVTLVNFLRGEHLDLLYEKPCVQSGGEKGSIPTIWEPIPMVDGSDGGGDGVSEWEVSFPKVCYPRLRNWRKFEFN